MMARGWGCILYIQCIYSNAITFNALARWVLSHLFLSLILDVACVL